VLHAVRKIEAERATDEKLSEELDVIRRMIEE
jgi:chromosomal replication initiator protein